MKNCVFFIILSISVLSSYAQNNFINVGDIVEIGNHKAIVFYVDDSGKHGKAMMVKALRNVDNPWCNNGKYLKRLPDLSNKVDGEINTSKIVDYAKSENILHYFPVFQWCCNLGNGWYIPSVDELELFVNFWLGNNEILDWDVGEECEMDKMLFYKEINNKLLDAGGTAFINGVYTSTVNDEGRVYVFYFDRKNNTWQFNLKKINKLGDDCVGRAFIKF